MKLGKNENVDSDSDGEPPTKVPRLNEGNGANEASDSENEEQDENSLWIKPITNLLINHGYLLEDSDVIRRFLALCRKFKKTQKVIGDLFIKFTEGNDSDRVDLALVNQFESSLNENSDSDGEPSPQVPRPNDENDGNEGNGPNEANGVSYDALVKGFNNIGIMIITPTDKEYVNRISKLLRSQGSQDINLVMEFAKAKQSKGMLGLTPEFVQQLEDIAVSDSDDGNEGNEVSYDALAQGFKKMKIRTTSNDDRKIINRILKLLRSHDIQDIKPLMEFAKEKKLSVLTLKFVKQLEDRFVDNAIFSNDEESEDSDDENGGNEGNELSYDVLVQGLEKMKIMITTSSDTEIIDRLVTLLRKHNIQDITLILDWVKAKGLVILTYEFIEDLEDMGDYLECNLIANKASLNYAEDENSKPGSRKEKRDANTKSKKPRKKNKRGDNKKLNKSSKSNSNKKGKQNANAKAKKCSNLNSSKKKKNPKKSSNSNSIKKEKNANKKLNKSSNSASSKKGKQNANKKLKNSSNSNSTKKEKINANKKFKNSNKNGKKDTKNLKKSNNKN